MTHFLAKGCAQLALLSIRSNFNYIPHASGTRTEFDSNSCEIVSIVYGLENTTTHEKVATIVTRANHRSVFTVLETHVSVKNPNFVYDSSASLYFTDITHREILDL